MQMKQGPMRIMAVGQSSLPNKNVNSLFTHKTLNYF